MGGQSPRHNSAATASALDTALFEPGELRDYFGFAVNAIGRRRGLAFLVLLLFVGATIGAMKVLPRQYHSEARLYTMPVEGSPGALRAASGEPAGLVQGAAEVILTEENLKALVAEHDLLSRWISSRAPLGKLIDHLRDMRGEAPDAQARDRALIDYLRKKLSVQVKGAEVHIAFDWPEARTAYAVVQSASQRLLAVRREAELGPLQSKSISLEESARAAKKRIEIAVAGIDAAIEERHRGARPATVRGLQAEGIFRDLPDQKLAQLRQQVLTRQKAIADAEEARRKRLSELQSIRAEQRATLGPQNAALLDTEEKIAVIEREGAQIDGMKSEEQALLAEYVRAGGKEVELLPEPGSPAWPAELKEDDQVVASAKVRVAMEQASLQRLLDEATEVRAALAAARSSFESRYAVLTPPEVPEHVAFPNLPLVLIAAALGGILLASFSALAADLRGAVIRETWQAQRRLDLPVLAEVPAP